jgi:Domain of unknown function (DUF5915)
VEILRTVQDARKQAGLNVSDRIVLNIDGNEPVMAAMSAHREYIVSAALVNGWQAFIFTAGIFNPAQARRGAVGNSPRALWRVLICCVTVRAWPSVAGCDSTPGLDPVPGIGEHRLRAGRWLPLTARENIPGP